MSDYPIHDAQDVLDFFVACCKRLYDLGGDQGGLFIDLDLPRDCREYIRDCWADQVEYGEDAWVANLEKYHNLISEICFAGSTPLTYARAKRLNCIWTAILNRQLHCIPWHRLAPRNGPIWRQQVIALSTLTARFPN